MVQLSFLKHVSKTMWSLVLVVLVAHAAHAAKYAIQGVEREQYTGFTHVDHHRIANEFDLIVPEAIVKVWEPSVTGEKENNLRGGDEESIPATRRRELELNGWIPEGATYEIKALLNDGDYGIANHDLVKVNFASSHANGSDWIAAYSPANVDITTTAPVKWANCSVAPGYIADGVGNVTFNFTNLREDVSFYYFTGGLYPYPVAVNTTLDVHPNVYFTDPNEPIRPRIVPTGDYDTFHLLWSTNNSANPTMKWGTTSGNYDTTVLASTSRLERDSMCGGAPADVPSYIGSATGKGWRDTGAIHTAAMSGMTSLEAGTIIYYIFGDSEENNWSSEFLFTVPPQAGQQPPSRPTTAILLCDLGRGSTDDAETWNDYGRPAYNTTRFAGARAQAGEIDVVFHGGDVSYATGYLAVWDWFMDMLSPLSSRVLYLTTVGNHEADWLSSTSNSLYNVTDSGGECGVATQTFLPMPSPATVDAPWWSYDVGLFHFIGLSTEHNFTACSDQYNWLEKDLEAVNRTATPWIILNGHRAMYVSSTFNTTELAWSDGSAQTAMINNLEPLLWKYQVNVGFYGHNHVYQRQSAVFKEIPIQKSTARTINGQTWNVYDNPQATVQVVIGNAGATFSSNAWENNPDWCEEVRSLYGYSVMTAVNSTYLEWVMYDSNEHNEESVFDRIVVMQDVTALGAGWVNNNASLDTSTATCVASDSTGGVDDNSSGFLQSTAFVIILAVVIPLACCALIASVYYSQKKVEAADPAAAQLHDSSFRTKSGANNGVVVGETLRNPLMSAE